jgi:hypothetical protein
MPRRPWTPPAIVDAPFTPAGDLTVLGAYRDKVVAEAALEEMVAKGFPREELSVKHANDDRS